MKRIGLFRLLFAATLFLAIGLRAEDAKPAPKETPADARARRQAELLKRFDKNGDGKLDDDERAEAKEAMMKEQMDRQAAQAARAALLGTTEQDRAKILAEFDKNKDGKLDDAERAEAEKAMRERAAKAGAQLPGLNMRAELIRRLDKNGDGKLDEVEMADGITYIAANLDQFPGIKQRFDKNHDGKLDDQERIALDEGLQQFIKNGGGPGADGKPPTLESLPPAMREQALKRFDQDGDGKLNESELAAMQAEMAKRREQRMQQVNAKGGGAESAKEEKKDAPPVVDKEEQAALEKAMSDFAPKTDGAPKK